MASITVRFWSSTPGHYIPHAGWMWSNFLRRLTPGSSARWGALRMVLPDEPADWTVVINHILKHPQLRLDKTRAIVLQTEPYVVRHKNTDWCEYQEPQNHDFAATWTIAEHHFPLDWYVTPTYTQLQHLRAPKTKTGWISACQTTKVKYPGHRLRVNFVRNHLSKLPRFELWGWPMEIAAYRGRLPRRAKDDALFPFPYHFCAENSSELHYFTEKIGDAWLAECLPLYWGCPDLASFFPAESFVWLPLEEPSRALEIVEKTMRDGERLKRISAIREAKRRVLNQYQVWAVLERIIQRYGG